MAEKHVVTGAYGFSGSYIAGRLLREGHRVATLTDSGNRASILNGRVTSYPYHFSQPTALEETLRGAAVLYNNYWVRFNHPPFSFCEAVHNSSALFAAARKAGVRRIVHISITNPSAGSPYEYFRGKAQVEKALAETGIPYSILRPAVLFGKEDILVNNIAWFLRRFPVFGVFGDGRYKMQPIYVDDLAALAVRHGGYSGNVIVDAIGPETFSYRDLVVTLAHILNLRRRVLPVPPSLAYLVGRWVGRLLGDVTITRDEMSALMAGLLCTTSKPSGTTKLTEWAAKNRAALGRMYHHELKRRVDRARSYVAIDEADTGCRTTPQGNEVGSAT